MGSKILLFSNGRGGDGPVTTRALPSESLRLNGTIVQRLRLSSARRARLPRRKMISCRNYYRRRLPYKTRRARRTIIAAVLLRNCSLPVETNYFNIRFRMDINPWSAAYAAPAGSIC